MIHSLVIIRDLKTLLSDSLRQTLREVKRPRGDGQDFTGHVLDVYTSSGHLLRASSAFSGTLTDFMECVSLTGDLGGFSHDGRLLQCTAFFADAVDTFGSTIVRLSPEIEEKHRDLRERFSTNGNATDANGEGSILCRVIEDDSPTIDQVQMLLAEVKQTHELLRRSINNLRRMIKDSYNFSAVV